MVMIRRRFRKCRRKTPKHLNFESCKNSLLEKIMKAKIYILLLMVCLVWNKAAFAQFSDGSGWANYAYLVKIYQENLRRFIQLKEMIQQARDHDQYIRALNYGLDNAMGLAQVLP